MLYIKKFILMTVFLFIFFTPQVFSQTRTVGTAVIREMTGTVELKRPGTDNWVAARTGETLAASTIISTGIKSTAVLVIGSNTLTVRPITRLSLEELVTQDSTETVNVNLTTGKMRIEVKPPAGTRASATFTSPSAVASVRGTTFEIDGVSITVEDGTVVFAPTSTDGDKVRSFAIKAGQRTWIDTDTGKALHPMVAQEILRGLPIMPGENQWSFGRFGSGPGSSGGPGGPGGPGGHGGEYGGMTYGGTITLQ